VLWLKATKDGEAYERLKLRQNKKAPALWLMRQKTVKLMGG